MQPDVSPLSHVHGIAGTAHDEHFLDQAAGERAGRVDILFQRYDPAAAHAFIGGDHELAVAIGDPARQRFRRKATKDNRMDRPDPSTGQHRIGRLQDHRHIDRHPVALLDAHLFEDIGKPADRAMQLPVCDSGIVRRVIAFPDECHLVAARRQVAVDAVDRNV